MAEVYALLYFRNIYKQFYSKLAYLFRNKTMTTPNMPQSDEEILLSSVVKYKTDALYSGDKMDGCWDACYLAVKDALSTKSSKIAELRAQRPCLCKRREDSVISLVNGNCPGCGGYFVPSKIASLHSDIVRLREALRRNAESVPRYETHGHFCGYRTLYEATKQRSKEALTPSSPKTVERYREKDGRLIHDGDCRFWSWKICTCGLLHWLAPQIPKDEWFYQESAEQEKALGAPTTGEKEI